MPTADFDVSGNGFLILPLRIDINDTVLFKPFPFGVNNTAAYGLLVPFLPGNTGLVTASVGTISTSGVFGNLPEGGVTVIGVYYGGDFLADDAPLLKVLIQVKDNGNNVQTTPTLVQLKLVGNAPTLVVAAETPAGTCLTHPLDGTCTVSLAIPAAWFRAAGANVTLFVGHEGAALPLAFVNLAPPALRRAAPTEASSLPELTSLTTVKLLPAPETVVAQDVVMTLPRASQFAGGTFTVPIHGQVGYQISTFVLRLFFGPHLEVITVTPGDKVK